MVKGMNIIMSLIIGASVLLAWDYPPELRPGIQFKVYYAESPPATNWQSTPLTGDLAIRVEHLQPFQTYRFYVVAVNQAGVQSVPSDWLEWAPPLKIPFLTVEYDGVRVYGDQEYDYTLEYSPDLVHWTPVGKVKGDGTKVPFYTPGKKAFYRARG